MIGDTSFNALNKWVKVAIKPEALDNPFASMGQRNLVALLEALALVGELGEELIEKLAEELAGDVGC